MRKKWFFTLVIILISLLAIKYLLFKPAFHYVSDFLSKTEQVKANILVVEGWLPDSALETAYKEFQRGDYDYIVTTGMVSYNPYYMVYSNGSLVFYPHKLLSGMKEAGRHTIEVDCYSAMSGINRAHFSLFINDSPVSGFYTEKRKKIYEATWNGIAEDIDSVSVQFDNDNYGKFGDRNLFVREIIIDHKIRVPWLNNSVYAIKKPGGFRRIVNNLISNAEFAKSQLIALGIDSSKIRSVSAKRVRINRTLTSSIAFRDWLSNSGIEVRGINIISMGPHARRTWMTYNKVLNEKYKIGIISLSDSGYISPGSRKILKTLRETIGLIYYWVILLPY